MPERYYVSELEGFPIRQGMAEIGARLPELTVTVLDRLDCHREMGSFMTGRMPFGSGSNALRQRKVRAAATVLAARLNEGEHVQGTEGPAPRIRGRQR